MAGPEDGIPALDHEGAALGDAGAVGGRVLRSKDFAFDVIEVAAEVDNVAGDLKVGVHELRAEDDRQVVHGGDEDVAVIEQAHCKGKSLLLHRERVVKNQIEEHAEDRR